MKPETKYARSGAVNIAYQVVGEGPRDLDDLDAARPHPRRGIITGRDVLIVVARHTAEHWGEAQLTRSLLKARTGGRQP